jgi:hypothetical protein
MDASRMTALERAATSLATRNHGHYLREALQVLRDPEIPAERAPVAALRLLAALQDSEYASRPDQKAALAAVGSWLEGWLVVCPTIAAAELARDLAWLVRLSLVYDAGRMPQDGRATAHFGQRIKDIERLRSQVATRREDRRDGVTALAPAQPTPPDAPAVDIEAWLGRIQTGNAAQEVPRLLAAVADDARREVAARLARKLKPRWIRERADKGVEWARTVLSLLG